MRIAFITPELQPLVRRTNLAEVAAALPQTLIAKKQSALVFLPHTVDVDPNEIEGLTKAKAVLSGAKFE